MHLLQKAILPLAGLFSFLQGGAAQTVDPRARLEKFIDSTSLDREGVHPWHLRMSFQIYNLDGGRQETGTVEEWWASPTSTKVVISSPSYKLVDGKPPTGRTAFLIRQLLDQVVHPIPRYGSFDGLEIKEAHRKFGGANLICAQVIRPAKDGKSSPLSLAPEFCSEPDSDLLRVYFNDGEGLAIIRNKAGVFQGTNIAVDNIIGYGIGTAITGHVDLLETIDSKGLPTDLARPEPRFDVIPGIVTVGRILRHDPPNYPTGVAGRPQGSVVMCAIVAKDGKITMVDTVATPDADLTGAAIDAVKKWTYEPFLMNGQPVEVQTVITMSFSAGLVIRP